MTNKKSPAWSPSKMAIKALKLAGEPTKCDRCGGKPGDPSCGKSVHAIMDAFYKKALKS